MLCPRCQTALDELDRGGITVDRCSSCRGIWLDRGELEKLLAREVPEQVPGGYARPPAYPPERPRYAYDDREPPSSDRRGHHGYPRHGKHRSFWHELFD